LDGGFGKVQRLIEFVVFLLLAVPAWAQRGTLSYSTYLGGDGAQEAITDIKIDSSGDAYVTYYDRDDTGPSHDFMVGKISPSGRNGYTTVLGHFYSEESAASVAIDALGYAYVTGWAYSYPSSHPRFPTLNALQPEPAGGVDAVVVKLNPQGEVVFSTYLGGSGNDYGRDIAIDALGNIYVTGTTSSDDFATRSPYQAQRAAGGSEGTDVFVTKINAAGSAILYSTFLGGNDDDSVSSIVIDGSGSIYLAGSTRSSSFAGRSLPGSTAGCTVTEGTSSRRPCWNGYAVKFNPDGSDLIFSIAWSDAQQDHLVLDAAVDAAGNLYVAEPGLVRKLNSSGSGFAYSRNIPARVSALTADRLGNVYATASTEEDLQVLKVSPDGGDFALETSLSGTVNEPGGAGASVGMTIAVSVGGNVYVGGYSESLNFPTTNGSTRSPWTRASSQDAIFFVLQP
jgi:hypothetical protein